MRPELVDLAVSSLLEQVADHPGDAAAALLRAIVAVGSPAQRKAASLGLAEVTSLGFYPPDSWAGVIGRAVPGRAWRRYDVFGDGEAIAVTFGYGSSEHAVLVRVDLTRRSVVTEVAIETDPSLLPELIEDDSDPLYRWEPLDLTAARVKLESALARPAGDPSVPLTEDSRAALAVVRARLRRLPRSTPGNGSAVAPADDGARAVADRQAAVAAFLRSPAAAAAGDREVVRFWAEVISGYGALVRRASPTLVGPMRLARILLMYVPSMFELTAEQRQAMPAAAGAWAGWAAEREGLEGDALVAVDEGLAEISRRFDAVYNRPENRGQRGYVADVSATTEDGAVLASTLARRAIAVPHVGTRTGANVHPIVDVTDSAQRRAVVSEEFGDCDPPDDVAAVEFVATAVEVSEQLWHDDPPQLWQSAQPLIAAGVPEHEIMHELVAAAIAARGPAGR